MLHDYRIHSFFVVLENMSKDQCVNIVQIPSFSAHIFHYADWIPIFAEKISLFSSMRENTDQKNL